MADVEAGKGLFTKYEVHRTDGSTNEGGKHHECEYFVLDMNHDRFAIAALKAYVEACEGDYPLLAKDLKNRYLKPKE